MKWWRGVRVAYTGLTALQGWRAAASTERTSVGRQIALAPAFRISREQPPSGKLHIRHSREPAIQITTINDHPVQWPAETRDIIRRMLLELPSMAR